MSEAAKNSGSEKRVRPGAKGVVLFKDGKYTEAISEFTKYLESEIDDTEKKVAHYNRGMAHHHLGKHSEALEDGEKCVKIDPFWAKGYKCKGVALEGMRKPRDAIDTLLNGQKMCFELDQNTSIILDPLINRLNKETGFIEEDLDMRDRMWKEKYCVVCKLFENDIKGTEIGKDKRKKYLSCEVCKMVNYCDTQHRVENEDDHKGVCRQLLELRNQSQQMIQVQLLWGKGEKDGVLFHLAQHIKGPVGIKMKKIMKEIAPSKDHRKGLEDMKDYGDGDLIPIQGFRGFGPVSQTELETLNTWKDWFSLDNNKETWKMMDMVENSTKMMGYLQALQSEAGSLTNSAKVALTVALTDPMTVIHMLKQAGLLTKLVGDKVIRFDIVGAEPREESLKMLTLLAVFRSIGGPNLRVTLIGPLMSSPLASACASDDPVVVTSFGGTYQDFLLSDKYKKPDFIVAFYPGIYDPTYNWTPAIAHAIVKNIPFLVTCASKEDYSKTKEWLERGSNMKPNIVLDFLNPFSSLKLCQLPPGSNTAHCRNMYCLLLQGGNLGGIGNLLNKAARDNLTDIIGGLARMNLLPVQENSLQDILKLKKADMM